MTRLDRLRVLLIEPDPRAAKVLQQSLATWEEAPIDVEWLDDVLEGRRTFGGGGPGRCAHRRVAAGERRA